MGGLGFYWEEGNGRCLEKNGKSKRRESAQIRMKGED
jgi:hypothetical protein